MSDPFAIRMNFKRSYLEKLTSNPASQMRAASYALKYRDQDEDLHSCILESLDAANINLRANIMYFIDYLCELSAREGHNAYLKSVQRDLPRIIELVAPGTRAGGTNVKVVSRVLGSLGQKNLLPPEQLSELNESLSLRSKEAESAIANPPTAGLVERSDGIHELDHETIEQRMEEDRERHKRLREDAWAVDALAETEVLIKAARRAGGLTEKLLRECRDDAVERGVAEQLDRGKWDEVLKGRGLGEVEMTG